MLTTNVFTHEQQAPLAGYLQLVSKHFVPREGFKPPTFALGKPCSIQLSYREYELRRSTTNF